MDDDRERGALLAFGAAVREYRTRLGLSQEALGFRAGLDRTYVSGIERGVRNPTLRIIYRLARALESTGAELLLKAEEGLSVE
jgi:transcriptional regulator with XRE-family HTH domain